MTSGTPPSLNLPWVRPVRYCAQPNWPLADWPGQSTLNRMDPIGCPVPRVPTFWEEWFPRDLPWFGVTEEAGTPRFWLWGCPKGLAAQAAFDVLAFFGRDRGILTPLSRQRLAQLPQAMAVAVFYTPD